MRIGSWLRARGRLKRGEAARLARSLQVSVRTLSEWRGREGEFSSPGRPAHAPAARELACEQVRAVLEQEGVAQSWRGAERELLRRGIEMPTKLVQASVRAIKGERDRRRREHVDAVREHVEVHEGQVLWSADMTDLGRSVEGQKVEGAVVRDVAAKKDLALCVGDVLDAGDLVALLRKAQVEARASPWVLSIDNGGPQRSEVLQAWARDNQVILLRSVPRTPQHNAWIERGIGELKGQAGLGRCEPLVWPMPEPLSREARACMPWETLVLELRTRMDKARRLLELWRRGPRESSTAALDRSDRSADDRDRRARFYMECRAAIEMAVEGLEGARERRRAEREAIWCTLEGHGVVTRTRGRRTPQPSNSAIIS